MDETLSLREAAEYLQVSIADLWSAAREGSLSASRVVVDGREVWRFEPEVLRGWSQPRTQPDATAAHLKTLEMLENTQAQMMQLQRQLMETQLLAAQGQRLLAENAESTFEQKAELQYEKSLRETLSEELKLARQDLARWESFRKKPWWRRLFDSA